MNTTTEIGNAGTNLITSFLTKAAHADVRRGSYAEDSQKCDIIFTFSSAFDKQELCQLGGQAKTGSSFYKIDPNQKTVRIDNCGDVKGVMAKGGLPIIIFIVSTDNEIYWYAPDLRSKKIDTIRLPKAQVILPSIWIDFSRMHRYWQYQANRYVTQTMTEKKLDRSFIKSCKNFFKSLIGKKFNNPLTGDIIVTNKSWEHITRISRSKTSRQMAIRSARHLHHFLDKNPDRMDTKNINRVEKNGLIYETREIIFFYRNGVFFNNSNYTFSLKLDELIIYPKNWHSGLFTVNDVKFKRKVASWWIRKNTY